LRRLQRDKLHNDIDAALWDIGDGGQLRGPFLMVKHGYDKASPRATARSSISATDTALRGIPRMMHTLTRRKGEHHGLHGATLARGSASTAFFA